MTRAYLDYAASVDARGAGFDPDTPVAGYYRMRMRMGGHFVGVRIWHGAPIDPVTGEEMDRSLRWQAEINGSACDIDRVWPKCAAEPADAAEYRHLCALQTWAIEHAPDSAIADHSRRPDPLTTPLMF